MAQRDAWAEWLMEGRDAHLSGDALRAQQQRLHELRDRVLKGARIQAGHSVLDIGAGTGLVALAAGALVEPAGQVVALDISADALAQCRADAGAGAQREAVRCLVGSGSRLPFSDGSFDVALTRSVLIYIADKEAAVAEMFRVLRPGGRVSILEPINAAAERLGLPEAGIPLVPEELRSRHERVTATFEASSRHWVPMMGFDERDLVRTFLQVGFEAVGLTYELLVTRSPASAEQTRRSLVARGNPTAPTWTEAANEALGPDAAAYLDAYVESQDGRTRTEVDAVAYLTAIRGAGADQC